MRRLSSIRAMILAVLGLAVFGAAAAPAQARPGWREGMGERFDAEQPGQRRGEPRDDNVRERQRAPLWDVARKIGRRYGGQMLDARIVDGGPRGEMYVIKWLTDDGRKIEFLVDAATGGILDQRGG